MNTYQYIYIVPSNIIFGPHFRATKLLHIYLGRAWASPTLAWLHCARVCVCLVLGGPTTYRKLQMSAFKYFTMVTSVLLWLYIYLTSANKPWERAWRATARLQHWRQRERERRWFKLNACVGSTQTTYFLCYESDDRMTRHAVSDRQQNVRWPSLL